MTNLPAITLCLLTQNNGCPLNQYLDFIQLAVQGGVTCVQLREKNQSFKDLQTIALALKELLTPLNIPLIINDSITLAKTIKADGVHLGQQDASPLEARKILGLNKIIGLSIENLHQLELANQHSCIDYVAASAIFPSLSKLDCHTIWGLEGLEQVVRLSKHPVVAIGGITAKNVRKVINRGARGIAVINAIHAACQPDLAAAALIHEIQLGENDVRHH